jgi:nitroreductase
MDVFETIRTVLAVRQYQDTLLPKDAVNKILDAGRLTASASNKQPWHFIVVDDRETLRQLGGMARTGPYIAQAPLAIVVAMSDTKLAESDASRAIQSMILAAWDMGIGSNWVGFYGLDAVKPLLGIPAEMKVLAILPFGYPAKALGRGKKNRKPLAQVASHNKYGQPYS